MENTVDWGEYFATTKYQWKVGLCFWIKKAETEHISSVLVV